MVGHATEWPRRCDGLFTETVLPGSTLPGKMRGYGLQHWLELLGLDLRALYEVERQSPQRKSMSSYAVATHAERVLRMFRECA